MDWGSGLCTGDCTICRFVHIWPVECCDETFFTSAASSLCSSISQPSAYFFIPQELFAGFTGSLSILRITS
jgi:hypothetical protein